MASYNNNQGTPAQATYEETIARLEREIETHAETLASIPAWHEMEKAYRALVALAEVAAGKTTPLEQLLGFSASKKEQSHPGTRSETYSEPQSPKIEPGDPQESETIAEIEKGS